MYKRSQLKLLKKRAGEARLFIQVVTGPRQIGKTTLIHQVLDAVHFPHHFASADEAFSDNTTWIEQQWEVARLKHRQTTNGEGGLALEDFFGDGVGGVVLS